MNGMIWRDSLVLLQGRFSDAALKFPGVLCSLVREPRAAPGTAADAVHQRRGVQKIQKSLRPYAPGGCSDPLSARHGFLDSGVYTWWFDSPEIEHCAGALNDLAYEAGSLLRFVSGADVLLPRTPNSREFANSEAAAWMATLFREAARQPIGAAVRLRAVEYDPRGAGWAQGHSNSNGAIEYDSLGEGEAWTQQDPSDDDAGLKELRAYRLQCNPFAASAQLVTLLLAGHSDRPQQEPERGRDGARAPGRPQKSVDESGDPAADTRLDAEWKVAKASGKKRKEFAKIKGLSLNDLKGALNRVRTRTKRANK